MDIILVPLLGGVLAVLKLYYWVIFIRIILSLLLALNIIHFGNSFIANVYSALFQITEPAFAFIRRFIPPFGMFDFSPIVIIIAIHIAMDVVTRIIIKINAVSVPF